jgi:hypothetical protein
MRYYLPVLALLAWTLAAIFGVPPAVLRIAGPGVTCIATAIHIHDQIKGYRRRG